MLEKRVNTTKKCMKFFKELIKEVGSKVVFS